jgi:hypothetical protein
VPIGARVGRQDAFVPTVLGIDVEYALLEAWQRWLAPDPQPFLVAASTDWACEDEGGVVSRELADTYRLWWGVEKPSTLIWISARGFGELPKPTRAALVREQVRRRRGATPSVRGWQDLVDAAQLREQADGHRFVWWPSLLTDNAEEILTRVVSERRLPSRHDEVPEDVWQAAETVLPQARRLGGTFPSGSNMNCFANVMAAAGASWHDVLDDVAPFDSWLATACAPGGDIQQPGVVLVWRDREGSPVHAAVTIGRGWGLEKPSRDWHSPHAVVTVTDIMRMARHPGEHVERHTITR